MAIGITLIIVIAVAVLIYFLFEFKRMRHKVVSLLLIALIIFSYISAAYIFKDQDINFKSVSGLITASRLYFSWLGTVFTNFKSITTNAIHMDWETNKTAQDFQDPLIKVDSSK